jgi:glycosyltransferase involved in cell wall biosynthesis
MKEKILVFIPGYNCEKQIIRVLNQFDEQVMQYVSGILFVNNRSTDGTEEAVLNFKKEHTDLPLTVLRNNANYNLGGSHKVAFQYAMQNGFDYVIVLHGDDQGNIHDLLPYLENGDYRTYDCLLGSRFMKGSQLKGYSRFRIFGNRVFNVIYSLCIGEKIKDLGAGLNMYRTGIFENQFYHKFPDKLTFNCCMLFAANYYGHTKKFFPISWREEDQISNVKMFSQAKITLKMALKYRFHKKYVLSEFRENVIENYTSEEIVK